MPFVANASIPTLRQEPRAARWWVLIALFPVLLTVGCKRGFYFRTADRDAYTVISEKGAGPTWTMQPGFAVEPDQRSRFYDPTCSTDPHLPIPAPQLYHYQLPPLASESARPRNFSDGVGKDGLTEPPVEAGQLGPADMDEAPGEATELQSMSGSVGGSLRSGQVDHNFAQVVPASAVNLVPQAGSQADELPPQRDLPADVAEEIASAELLETFGQDTMQELPPVPARAWESLPESCLRRMLEFQAVRDEYERTYGRPVVEDHLDSAERLTLENILEIALINSREYQTRKETLYRVALRLDLQRFDYELKFLSRGNGTSLDYTHNRVGGVEVNTLRVPTGVGITKSLYTAGDLVARFANDVVLTFNGPAGYSASVGSEILVDLSQPLIQRDIRFEPLVQAERDVVYAARDFVQFRKQLFRDLAVQYYNLLLTYRNIAINTQDYFSNLGEFNRALATEETGGIPPFQVDQFEQNVLRSRGNLINSCNALEGALDRLKLRIGLPTELPINLDLSELEELTLRDEASVLREQIERKAEFYQQQRERSGIEAATQSLTALALSILELTRVNLALETATADEVRQFEILVARLEVEAKRVEARSSEDVMLQQGDTEGEIGLLPAQTFLRDRATIELILEAIQRELYLLQLQSVKAEATVEGSDAPSPLVQILNRRWQQLVRDYNDLGASLQGKPYFEQSKLLPAEIEKAKALLATSLQLERETAQVIRDSGIHLSASQDDLRALGDSVLQLSQETVASVATGLVALDVNVDEAMLTALVQRLDLMNQRGALADAWRQIKYAGDDLRSILNLRATQSIRTRSGSNNPFDFTFDDSTTRLALDFDTPLNRRVERNVYRLALINYNAALRTLIEAQDNVKLDIRDDLRAIELDRNQYDIAIASAALAYERVTSTRLQVTMAQNVTARDFLEAQQAYTQSLSSVAQQHIGYIVDRIQFFLDLEQLQVDQLNFWPDLRNEDYPFVSNTDFGYASPDGYGALPVGPWYSECLERMEEVPPGASFIHRSPDEARLDVDDAETVPSGPVVQSGPDGADN